MAQRRGSRSRRKGAPARRRLQVALTLAFAAASLALETSPVGAADGARLSAQLPEAAPVSAEARAAHDADVAAARALESQAQVDGDDPGDGPSPAVVDGRVAAFDAPPPPDEGASPEPPAAEAPSAVDEQLVTEDRKPTAAPGRDERVEVEEERDQYQTVFENPDGTRTIEMTSMPANYLDEKGAWQPIDNRLVPDKSGALVSSANEWQVRFSPMTEGGVELSAPDGAVSFRAQNASGVAPVLEPDGTSVRYPDVFPGADLVYRSRGRVSRSCW